MKKHIYTLLKWLLFGALTTLLSFAISISLIQHAAKKGSPKAQATLGYMYFFGTGVEQSKTSSIKWFALAAKSAVRCGIQNVVNTGRKVAKTVTTQVSHIAEVLTIAPWREPAPQPNHS